jgi:hypothetical protein
MAYKIGTDRVLETAAAPAGGNVVLGGAVAGFRTFSSVLAANDTCAYYIEAVDPNGVPVGPWERGFGTLVGGPALARTKVVESSYGAGSLVNFAGPVRAGSAPMSDTALVYPQPGGRLSTSSTPVADVLGSSTLYYVPYVHNKVPLWTGAGIRVIELSAGVVLNLNGLVAANTCYDVFGYANGNTLVLEALAWSSLTARATTLAFNMNGFICKSTDATRRYLGSFYASAANNVFDFGWQSGNGNPARRHLWNMYNRVPRQCVMTDLTATWTYQTSSWRIIRGQLAPQGCIEVMRGLDEDPVYVVGTLSASPGAGYSVYGAIGIDGPGSLPMFGIMYNSATSAADRQLAMPWVGTLGMGFHYLCLLENSGTTAAAQSIGWNYGGCGLWATVYA